jgi:dihydropteroate synthase
MNSDMSSTATAHRIEESGGQVALPPCPVRIMGILNVTPDSFSDGGRYLDPDAALTQARRLIEEGADIVDVGGESTRPGAERVPAAEQIQRTCDVIARLRAEWAGPISIDTTSATVARAACTAGADWINDISGLRDDPEMIAVAATTSAHLVIMHMQGSPQTMQTEPHYDDVTSEVRDFLLAQAEHAVAEGVKRTRIVIDPGIGFGKSPQHNLTLLRNLQILVATDFPVLIGISRKSLIGRLTGATADDRVVGSIIGAVLAAQAGAQIVRVHDVLATRQALRMAHTIMPFPAV